MALSVSHDQWTVQQLKDLYRNGRLNLAPAFQRDSVWTSGDRQALVVSVLRGFPIPSIYLAARSGRGGKVLYDVIDGKQRIETILWWLGTGPLSHPDEKSMWVRTAMSEEDGLDWWLWRHLSNDQKHDFLSTRLPVIEVNGDLAEVIDLFVRINSTGRRLTPAERRNAKFFTDPVLRTAQQVADEFGPYLRRAKVISIAQAKRMRHVELMTELLLSVHAGTPLNKKASIDRIMQSRAMDTQTRQAAAKDLRAALKVLNRILPDIKTTRFRRIADFYTLVLLIHRYRADGCVMTAHDSARNRLAGELLTEFGAGVDELSERNKSLGSVRREDEQYRRYLLTVREGTDSSANRTAREKLLRDLLDGVFEHRDAKRRFTPTQRRVLWHASRDRPCNECAKPIKRWEDIHLDHVEAFAKGGRTDLTNAALTHWQCNLKKGAS